MITTQDVLTFVEEEDVKFIRLAFFDVLGRQKNISIQPSILAHAFEEGFSLDASLIDGFEQEEYHNLYLKPDASTMSILPWRSIDGAVIRLYCNVYHKDDRPFENDPRFMLRNAVKRLKERGLDIDFGSEIEFYLFKEDDFGNNSYIPLDQAGYMDIAPKDKGENVRRDICLTLADMGIEPESSHHEQGPGQNEVDFHYQKALLAADNAYTFKWVVKAVADSNGLYADFTPKPLKKAPGNGMHINVSLQNADESTINSFMAGIMDHIQEMTLFLNPTKESYDRLEFRKAPKYISWSTQNHHQLIRILHTKSNKTRIKLRLADPTCNVYLAYMLIIQAGLDGINRNLAPIPSVDADLYKDESMICRLLNVLPQSLNEAKEIAKNSEFIKNNIPKNILEVYLK